MAAYRNYATIDPDTGEVIDGNGDPVTSATPGDAGDVPFTPAGAIAATDVQAAIVELDSEKQPLDADLTAFAGLSIAADKLPYGTGSHTLGLADLTAAGRAIIDDADAAAQRTTLGLGTAAVTSASAYEVAGAAAAAQAASQPLDADLTAIAALTTTSTGRSLLAAANAAAIRTIAGAIIGTDVQAYDADLAAIASLTTTTIGRSLLAAADEAALRAIIDLTIGGDVQAQSPALQELADAGVAANKMPYYDASADGALTTLSSFARSFLDDADAATVRGTIGAGTSSLALGTSPSTQAFGDSAVGGSATDASKTDHKHAMPALGGTPTTQTFGDSADNGAGTTVGSISTHKHAWPTAAASYLALMRSSGAAGTSMPGSPSTDDMFRRTDLDMDFYYDGTRWLSSQLFHLPLTILTSLAGSLSATQSSAARLGLIMGVGTDIWLEKVMTTYFIATGATALGASHKWVGTVQKVDTANAVTGIATVNIASGASGTWRQDTQSIGALCAPATYPSIRTDWAKTGTPGDINITANQVLTYRIVQT